MLALDQNHLDAPIQPPSGLIRRPPKPDEPALYTRDLGCIRMYLNDVDSLVGKLRQKGVNPSVRIGRDLEVPEAAALKETHRADRGRLTIVTEKPEIVILLHGERSAVSTTDHTGGGRQLADEVVDFLEDRRSTWVWLGPGVTVALGWFAAMVADVVVVAALTGTTRLVPLICLLGVHSLVPLTFGTKKALRLRHTGRVALVPVTVAERRISWSDMIKKLAAPILGAGFAAVLTFALTWFLRR
jgi:hypothetical protein